MKFTKLQGAGNDFVLVESTDANKEWRQSAIDMCDRHYGIGSDGLLVLLPSEIGDVRMRVFNTDGSEAETCGNGLRCVARYIIEKGMVNPASNQILIETISGLNKVNLPKNARGLPRIQVNMGIPRLKADEIGIAVAPDNGQKLDINPTLRYLTNIEGQDILLNFVSMGNPHAIYFAQQPVADFPLSQIGPKVEKLAIAHRGLNFEIARVINRGQIEVRVWEKGVGETLACGSGSCATAVAAQLNDYIDNNVDIILPGGTLHVEWDGTGDILLSGPAEIVFTGEWPDK